MRIAVMGAGALGGYIGARLAEAGEEVAFVARGAHLASMRANGLRILSPVGDLHLSEVTATADPAAIGPVDLVLFTVKLWDTKPAAAALSSLIGPQTRVVTLQNGIDSVDLIAEHVAREQIIAGVTYIPALVVEPAVIRSPSGEQRIVVDRDEDNPVIAELKSASDRAKGIALELVDGIRAVVWQKFVRFSAFSAATSLMRSTAGPILSNPESRAFLRQLVEDGVAIAAATGNAVGVDFVETTMAFFDTFAPTQGSSMSADIEHNRPLEVKWSSGRMHDLGLAHGVATPAHTAAWRGLILHADGSGTETRIARP
jgi:2-dehydropantoate 2-reductase